MLEVTEGMEGEFYCQARNLAGLGNKCSIKVPGVIGGYGILYRHNTFYIITARWTCVHRLGQDWHYCGWWMLGGLPRHHGRHL